MRRLVTRLNLAKHDETMSKNQFTGTAMQPQSNRKLCQFNKDQYCIYANKQNDSLLDFLCMFTTR